MSTPDPSHPDYRQLLFDLVMAWDADEDLDFLAATYRARKALGLMRDDATEEAEDEAVLRANGMLDEESTDD